MLVHESFGFTNPCGLTDHMLQPGATDFLLSCSSTTLGISPESIIMHEHGVAVRRIRIMAEQESICSMVRPDNLFRVLFELDDGF